LLTIVARSKKKRNGKKIGKKEDSYLKQIEVQEQSTNATHEYMVIFNLI
jgi:hypothetical protein